ncbi:MULTISPECIES: hypothetical protein [unclassified Bradyrhizobium]|uniref:hypothetical protein n=1 Tax=unclassified Bradyrhizobium TaxID=2631580 RepID=UPI0028EF8E76|nr:MULTISPECIES: hypothetical protein [unclassified Bradyrhizobium]
MTLPRMRVVERRLVHDVDADIPRNETFEQRELLPRMPELQHAFVTSLSLYSARYSAQCLFKLRDHAHRSID